MSEYTSFCDESLGARIDAYTGIKQQDGNHDS
jgi:hypothetical protein